MNEYFNYYASANFRKSLRDQSTGKDAPGTAGDTRRKSTSTATRQILQSLGEALPGFGDSQPGEGLTENMRSLYGFNSPL